MGSIGVNSNVIPVTRIIGVGFTPSESIALAFAYDELKTGLLIATKQIVVNREQTPGIISNLTV